MKELTTNAAIAASENNTRPVGVLRLELSSQTLYFADVEIESPFVASGKVLDWGSVKSAFFGDRAIAESASLKLSDHDGELWQIFAEEGLAGKNASIMLYFSGLSESDLVLLATGKVGGNPVWNEKDCSFALELTDILEYRKNRSVGTVATRDIFPDMDKSYEGRILPIAYGRVKRVRAVLTESGARTTLARFASTYDDTLIVTDASDFPSGQIRLRVGLEEMTGSFDGNVFNITERELEITSGTTVEESGTLFSVCDPNLAGVEDNAYTGYFLKIYLAERYQYRPIKYSVGDTGVLVFKIPFWLDDGDYGTVPAETDFSIISGAVDHDPGKEIVEVVDEYVYTVTQNPASAVEAVECWGIAQEEFEVNDVEIIKEEEGYVELAPQFYTVNLDDDRYASILGKNVTTISLRRLPKSVTEEKFLSHELYVTLRGPLNDDEEVLENPAEVIAHFLENFAGFDTSEMESDSFATAITARADYAFGFALEKEGSALSIAADMATQASMALNWREGKAVLEILENSLSTADKTLDVNDFEIDKLEFGLSPAGEVIGAVKSEWGPRGEKETILVTDTTATLDSLTGELDLWAVRGRATARKVSEFWLRRLRHAYREATVSAFLGGVGLERGDVVELDRDDYFSSGQKARVISVTHFPGNLSEDTPTRTELRLRLPVWEGCTTICEHACESGTCETSTCEMSCTTGAEVGCSWKCESSCEQVCELSCTATCESACQNTCQIFKRVPGETYSCENTCETDCEVSCEGFACETTDETGCATSCQAAGTESVVPVRAVKVSSAPSSQGGTATVMQVGVGGQTFGESFSATDSLDSHPKGGELSAAILNHNLQWVLLQSSRCAKFVSIISDNGDGTYTVQEQDASGNSWGSTFSASAAE